VLFALLRTELEPLAVGRCLSYLDNLLPLIKEGKIASDLAVTVRYKDLNLNPWSITGISTPGSMRASGTWTTVA
jgi:hypothetical protein